MNWLKRLCRLKEPPKGSDTGAAVAVINAEQQRIKSSGAVDGAHYIDYVEQVKSLKREKRHDEAIELLLKLVDATEAESRAAGSGWGVAPWYYEQLATLYRKERRFVDEVAILERYKQQPKAPGAGPAKLAKRLSRARELASAPQPQVAADGSAATKPRVR